MAEYEERTEQATPRKRQKAREDGQVWKSRELISIAATGGVVLSLVMGGGALMGHLRQVTARLPALQYGHEPFTVLRAASLEVFLALAPMFLATTVFATFAGAAQGGVVLKGLEFKFDFINPGKGLGRLFSMRGILETLKSLLKFVIGGVLFYIVIRKDLPLLPVLSAMGFKPMIAAAGSLLMKAIVTGFSVFLVVSVADVLVQRWQFERSLRMSKEEIRQEHKESEGDPKIKGRMKSLHMQMARRRMMEEVPRATVVITNPTHLAIALKYEEGKTAAPRIVAKGAGFVAQRIREKAREHRVPVVEDKPLARVLFALDLNDYIPEELYRAVAKILAYVFRLKGRAA